MDFPSVAVLMALQWKTAHPSNLLFLGRMLRVC